MKLRQAVATASSSDVTAGNYTVPVEAGRRLRSRKSFKIIRRLFAVVLIAVIGFLGFRLYQAAANLTGDKNPLSLLGGLAPADLKQTNGWTNILLAGYSNDDAGHSGADLTDSIMILSVNPTTKDAVVISVPRDLYVDIPGYGYSKINAAYEYGEQDNFSESGYPAGGMGLLEKTISNNFGVQFNYYALINYAAFKSAVDAVGGVTVDIQSSNQYGLYDPNTNLKLSNGTVSLDGQEALNLARARGEGYGSYGFAQGDFTRTANQQMLLLALKDKASSASVISNPLKIASLANSIGDNIKTDMTVGEMKTLYSKTKGLNDGSIKSVTLNDYDGKNLLSSYTTRGGQSALIPAAGVDDYGDIQAAVQQLLHDSSDTTSSSPN